MTLPCGKPVLLIVDDEPDIRATFSLLFEIEGFEVMTATDGLDALRQVALRRPDVVITDFMMPLMNGMQLCMQLRDRADTRNIPLIMSSSVPTPAGADAQRRCDYFIAKPADFVLLLEVVHRTLGRTA